MSENNLPQTIPPANNEIIEKKRTAWGNFGVALHAHELKLQAQSQQIINSIIIPEKYEQVAAAELALKNAKQEHIFLINDRKKNTDTIDGLKARLMKPEKSIEEPIAKATAAIIKLKKQKEEEDRKAELKLEEAKLLKEKILIYVADNDASILQGHAKLISDSYKHALNTIEPKDIIAYIAKIKNRLTVKNQTIFMPSLSAQYHTPQEVEAIIIENFKPRTATEYIESFATDIDRKYFDYNLAWNNKEQALKLDTEELEENKVAIEKEKNSNIVNLKLTTLSTCIAVGDVDVKPLKKVFKISMPETLLNAYYIITAYMNNIELCEKHLQIKNSFNLGVKQMITALEKVKNDDNAFNFVNITFEEQSKL